MLLAPTSAKRSNQISSMIPLSLFRCPVQRLPHGAYYPVEHRTRSELHGRAFLLDDPALDDKSLMLRGAWPSLPDRIYRRSAVLALGEAVFSFIVLSDLYQKPLTCTVSISTHAGSAQSSPGISSTTLFLLSASITSTCLRIIPIITHRWLCSSLYSFIQERRPTMYMSTIPSSLSPKGAEGRPDPRHRLDAL